MQLEWRAHMSDREFYWYNIVEDLKCQGEDFLLYLLDNGEPFNRRTLE